jgi:hypothetical protein
VPIAHRAVAVLLSLATAGCQPPTSNSTTDGLAPPGGASPASIVFPNAPSTGDGWAVVTDCPMSALPRLQPQANECGQQYWNNQISTVTLQSSPEDQGGRGFLRIGYPSLRNSSVNYGGFAPSSFALTGPFPQNTGHLYVGQYMRWSSNWWHPVNEGHKTFYLAEADGTTQHFFAWADNQGTMAGRLMFKFGTQWVENKNGNPYFDDVWTDQDPAHAVSKGEWHRVEILIVPNNAGSSDGQLRAWVDGEPVMDARNVPLFRPGATPRWQGIWYSPIFASTGAMPPDDQYFDLSATRVMVR